MDRASTHGNPRPTIAAGIVIAILAMIAIPAAIALHSAATPATVHAEPGASPYGYTWSLLLFVIPIVHPSNLRAMFFWDDPPNELNKDSERLMIANYYRKKCSWS